MLLDLKEFVGDFVVFGVVEMDVVVVVFVGIVVGDYVD